MNARLPSVGHRLSETERRLLDNIPSRIRDEVTLLPLRGLGLDYIPPDTSRRDKVQALMDRAPTCLSNDHYQLLSQACAAVPQVKGLGGARFISLPSIVTDPLQQLALLDPCAALTQIPRCPFGSTDPGVTDPEVVPVPEPGPPEDTLEEDEPNYALWGGLILVVVAAGGYAVYRGLK